MGIRWKVAYAVLGGAIAWFLHLLLVYAIGEAACVLEGNAFRLLGLSAAGWILVFTSLACFAASAGSIWISHGLKQHTSFDYGGKFGFWAGLLFSLAIFAQTFPLFFLLEPRC